MKEEDHLENLSVDGDYIIIYFKEKDTRMWTE
jgi:hypothetical protein